MFLRIHDSLDEAVLLMSMLDSNSVHRMALQKALDFSRCSLAKLRWTVLSFFENKDFILATVLLKPCCLSFLPIVPHALGRLCLSCVVFEFYLEANEN